MLVGCRFERPLDTTNKLESLLQVIGHEYVDTVDMEALVEKTIPKVLAELDPHSVYIPAKDVEDSNQELRGSFSGIGIQFMIQSDTIYVSDVISGGPAEKVGLMAGDRIVTIDDSLYVGKEISNDGAMKRLKGPKGSEVCLGIKRMGEKELLSFTIVRGNIPVKSIDANYLIAGRWWYMKINKFGETTYPEMLISLAQGLQQGAQGVIVDLRGNTGGYMGSAIQMVNEFLPKGDMIVYTEGEHTPRYEERANGRGNCQQMPIVVLTDETSASASEIFAGAIQDNDRGTIIGRRSFGKGLVQQPMQFNDGSEVRLTIARYHTPSGRCIQKAYEKGHGEDYENELLLRYERGEFYVEDSIRQDGPKYLTSIGRTVFGGGGIRPDIFIPDDSTGVTSYYKEAAFSGLIAQFCFEVVDQNRETLNELETMEDKVKWMDRQNMLESFARYGQKHGLPRRNLMLQKSRRLFIRAIYSGIIYNSSDMNDYLRYLNQDDPTVLRALEVIREGKTVPAKPIETETEAKDSTCVQ